VRSAAFLLSSNCSFVENLNAISEENEDDERSTNGDLFDELHTPMDEIKKLTEEIRSILLGETVTSSSSRSSNRGLKSLARAGSSKNAE